MKELQRRTDELKASLSLMKDASARREKMVEYEVSVQNGRSHARLFEDEMRAARARTQLSIHEDIAVAVRQLAKDRGVRIVLRLDTDGLSGTDDGKDDSKNVLSRVRHYELRQTLYAAEELDLTPEPIKMLQVPLDVQKDGAKEDKK